MINAMTEENGIKVHVITKGSEKELMQECFAILCQLFRDNIVTEDDLKEMCKSAVLTEKQMVEEMVQRMPVLIKCAIEGDEEAQTLVTEILKLLSAMGSKS